MRYMIFEDALKMIDQLHDCYQDEKIHFHCIGSLYSNRICLFTECHIDPAESRFNVDKGKDIHDTVDKARKNTISRGDFDYVS